MTLPYSRVIKQLKTMTLPNSRVIKQLKTMTLPYSRVIKQLKTMTLPYSRVIKQLKTMTLPYSRVMLGVAIKAANLVLVGNVYFGGSDTKVVVSICTAGLSKKAAWTAKPLL